MNDPSVSGPTSAEAGKSIAPVFRTVGADGQMQLAMSAQINLNDLTNVYVLGIETKLREALAARNKDVSELNRKKAANSDAITKYLSTFMDTVSTAPEQTLAAALLAYAPSTKAKVDKSSSASFNSDRRKFEYSTWVDSDRGRFSRTEEVAAPTEFLVLVDEGVKLAGELAAATSAVSHVRSAMANMDYVRRKAHALATARIAQQDPTANAVLQDVGSQVSGLNVDELIEQVRSA